MTKPRHLPGDCRESLPTLEAGSVDCVITSPPYWRQRDYGAAGQIGQEDSPEGYVAALVEVFGLVRRVLKREGVVFVNLGDGYRNKDLLLLPARFALAMQADGWILRSEIVWAKSRPIPESVADRPSAAHEKIWFFAKAGRHYYGNVESAMPLQESTWTKGPRPFSRRGSMRRDTGRYDPGMRDSRRHGRPYVPGPGKQTAAAGRRTEGFNARWDAGAVEGRTTRRLRNYEPAPLHVWRFAPAQFDGAHFATFPCELVERCLAAGCPAGGTVLDCFAGAGTTGLVAARLGYRSILCEVNPAYVDMAIERIEADRGGDDYRERKAQEEAGQCRLL